MSDQLVFKWVQDQTRANSGEIQVKEDENLRKAWYFNFLFHKLDKLKKSELDELKEKDDIENCKKAAAIAKELLIIIEFEPDNIKTVEIKKITNFAKDIYEFAQKKHYTLEDDDEMLMEMAGDLECMKLPHPGDIPKTQQRPGIRQEKEKEDLFSIKKSTKKIFKPSKK